MGWFWASSPVDSNKPTASSVGTSGKCPVDHKTIGTRSNQSSLSGDACPIDHSKRSQWLARGPDRSNNDLNPLNNMPNLSAQRASGQKIDLDTQRTQSSIPKGLDLDSSVWEYPSPQQMLNAMLRKGGEVPEDAVTDMVDVHNFLNEGAWHEILKWEQPYCESMEQPVPPRLLKFTGKPDELSPRARYYQFLRKLFPSKFGDPPFDRHDWTVLRHISSDPTDSSAEAWKQIRYIIDYYAGPDEANGSPTFFLDVRPALDSYDALRDRTTRAAKNLWDRAMRPDQ